MEIYLNFFLYLFFRSHEESFRSFDDGEAGNFKNEKSQKARNFEEI